MKKYKTILADPPWQYNDTSLRFGEKKRAGNSSAESQYPTMTLQEIKSLKIPTEDNAYLFLWVTNPFLWVGFQLLEAWSFNYKTDMVWVKNKGPSMGWFTVSRHEHLLIATRGEGMHPEYRPISWFNAQNSRHSKKPELIYKTIEKMYPKGKYLELFARNKRKNWESWGNEL